MVQHLLKECFMLKNIYLVIAGLVICLITSSPVTGQLRSATITGKITDAMGRAIPNIEIHLINMETGTDINISTNESGEYTFPYLQSGTYTVSIKPTTGFSEYKRTNVILGTSETARIDITLQAAGVGMLSVEVRDSGLSELQTEKTDVNSAVNSLIINNVPNVNHNPLAFTTLLPNVVGRGGLYDQSERQFGIGTESRIRLSALSVNGGAAFTNDIQLDGVSTQGSAYNEASVLPNTEGLQEVRVISNNFSAEYGRGQGVITLTTKSGTNDWHGSAFARIRNEGLNANSFENNLRGIQRKTFRPRTYGGTIGGPIYLPRFGEGGPSLWSGKNRAFFFLSYEGLDHLDSIDILRRVPTPRERVGDFSETYVNVRGTPERIRLFDPFNVRRDPRYPNDPNRYERAEIPNAVITNPDPFALYIYSFYPLPNRTPEGDAIYNDNNYYKRLERTFDKNNINSRVDFSIGNHSIYTTFGTQRGEILRPRSWGDNSIFENSDWTGNITSDKNPYGAVGTTLVFSPTLFVDLRYGINRRNALEQVFRNPGLDFNALGIPAAIQSIMPSFDYAPDVGVATGGWSTLGMGAFRRKDERATNHTINGSVTKTLGKWTLKAGGEYRVYLSNYEDFQEGSVDINSDWWSGAINNLTAQYITATGNPVENPDARTNGLGVAALFLGAGRIGISRGFNIRTAFAQKYLGLYTQNDWKANDKLTINLGLRWDLQPGPTDRFNHMSSIDLERKNPYGGLGYIAFPGTDGYSRNLWDTHYKDFGPRLGVAYRIKEDTVIRAGYGITYLPSNTGYFAGPSAYGMGPFTNGTDPNLFGINPSGVVVGRWNSLAVNNIVYGTGNAQVPQIYGNPLRLFDRKNYVSGRVHQWNAFIEKMFGQNWLTSVGYTAAKGTKLPFARIPLNAIRYLPESTLNAWRATYRASGVDPGDVQVTNSLNPNGTLPFGGVMRRQMIPLWLAMSQYPAFGTPEGGGQGSGTVSRSIGSSDYHAGTVRLSRRLSNGLQFDTHYTWSKSIDNAQSEAMSLIANETIDAIDIDPTRLNSTRKLSVTDVPHRWVISFVYELPFSKGGSLYVNNPILRNIVGGWRIGGAGVIQSGFPLAIRTGGNGSLNNRPDRDPSQPLELPKSYQRWYTGNTAQRTVTLPTGRLYTVCNNCYLKYNPDAFISGRVIPRPNGGNMIDRYWFGNAAYTYDDIRTDMRHNWDLSLSRIFPIGENVRLEISADAQNVFNRTQFLPGVWGRDLGNPYLDLNNRDKARLGAGQNTSFGTINPYNGTYSPRQIELKMKLSF
jgi:trimeric autotransporter adhesin